MEGKLGWLLNQRKKAPLKERRLERLLSSSGEIAVNTGRNVVRKVVRKVSRFVKLEGMTQKA